MSSLTEGQFQAGAQNILCNTIFFLPNIRNCKNTATGKKWGFFVVVVEYILRIFNNIQFDRSMSC